MLDGLDSVTRATAGRGGTAEAAGDRAIAPTLPPATAQEIGVSVSQSAGVTVPSWTDS